MSSPPSTRSARPSNHHHPPPDLPGNRRPPRVIPEGERIHRRLLPQVGSRPSPASSTSLDSIIHDRKQVQTPCPPVHPHEMTKSPSSGRLQAGCLQYRD
ncbi:unnamed protein product [Urochloa humidicola]